MKPLSFDFSSIRVLSLKYRRLRFGSKSRTGKAAPEAGGTRIYDKIWVNSLETKRQSTSNIGVSEGGLFSLNVGYCRSFRTERKFGSEQGS